MIACPANSVPIVKKEVKQIGRFVASKIMELALLRH